MRDEAVQISYLDHPVWVSNRLIDCPTLFRDLQPGHPDRMVRSRYDIFGCFHLRSPLCRSVQPFLGSVDLDPFATLVVPYEKVHWILLGGKSIWMAFQETDCQNWMCKAT